MSYANAVVTCNPCSAGNCACTITDCQTGILEIFSSCGAPPQYQLDFTGGTRTWQPQQSGALYAAATCYNGTVSQCTAVNVGTPATPTSIQGLVVNITNQNLVLNRTNDIKVLLGDEQCRLDRNKVEIRYTTILPIKVDPKKMTCSEERCVMECYYSITPQADWRDPVELSVTVNLTTNQVITVNKNLGIVMAATTTTTTTSTTTTTTVQRATDMREAIDDLQLLQANLRLVKTSIDGVAEGLGERDTRYTAYSGISSSISITINNVEGVISLINQDYTSATNRQKVLERLKLVRNSIQQILVELDEL